MRFLKFFSQSPDGLLHVDQNKLALVGSQLNSVVGSVIASAATIQVTSRIHHVTGTTAIVTITPPYPDFQGSVILIADAIWTWTAGGNIATAGTVTAANGHVELVYDGLKWYPSRIS